MSNLLIPREIKTAVQDNNLIIFVGAGLSYNLVNKDNQQLKGWKNLVVQLLIDLEKKEYDVTPFKMLLETNEPIDVLNLIEKNSNLPKNEIINFVKDFYSLKVGEDYSLHKNIYKLSNKIITTNYDDAFEMAIPELKNRVAFKGRNYELANLHKAKEPTLFKLHGCITNGESMVLFPTGYDALYNSENEDAERTLFYLKNLITNKHILFVGCGMGDFQINKIFKGVQQQLGKFNDLKHFIITKEVLGGRLDFLTPIMLSDFSEINDYILELVKIKEESQKTEEFLRLENQLEKTKKSIIENQKKVISVEQRLESLSNDFFAESIELHINNDYNAAIQRYKDVIKIKPDKHEALYNMGLAYSSLGEYGKAIESYEKALKIKPDSHEALYNMGNAYSSIGEYGKALESYDNALKIKPDKHETLNSFGFLYLKLGDIINAKPFFQKAIDFGSLDYGNMNMGHVCLAENDKEKALECYKIAVEKFSSKDAFFAGMEDDYQYLTQYGITREWYDKILDKLKT